MVTIYSGMMQTSDLPDAFRVVYSEELEFTAKPKLIYDQFVEQKNEFRARKGERVYWTTYRQLPPSLAILPENADPDTGKITDFQTSFVVDEYGYSIGTTEKLDLMSYQGPISSIVRDLLAPQMALSIDLQARNAFIGDGVAYRSFGGDATSRATLDSKDVISEALIRTAGYHLSARRVPQQGSGFVCVCHPGVTYDLMGLSSWREPQLYNQTNRIFTNEVGMLRGIRFIEADNAVLPNAGAEVAATTLAGAVKVGDQTATFTATTSFAVGQEVTVYGVAAANVTGRDEEEEHLVISAIDTDTKVVTFRSKFQRDHAISSKVKEGLDVYPLVFLGGTKPVGKGVVVDPEIRVALPTDRLRRMHFIGWYSLLGYGVIRDWGLEVWEVASGAEGYPAQGRWG